MKIKSVIFGSLIYLIIANSCLANPAPTNQLDQPINLGTDEDLTVGPLCSQSALARLIKHKIAPNETIATIASKYNLIPATIMGMNPLLQTGKMPVGTEIIIPPYNGIRVTIPAGQTWETVAKAYNVRADILFETNGCQPIPKDIFIPGVNWSPGRPTNPIIAGLSGYPLPQKVSEGLGYGWQLHPVKANVFFHSGLDLLATPGTKVLSVGAGVIAFAGKHQTYGNLIVVNHQAGKQTRYAHLDQINVKVGQKVALGEILGTVGLTGIRDIEAAHLHFEIRYNSPLGWVAENPYIYFKKSN